LANGGRMAISLSQRRSMKNGTSCKCCKCIGFGKRIRVSARVPPTM
jgi:hypothetical protein